MTSAIGSAAGRLPIGIAARAFAQTMAASGMVGLPGVDPHLWLVDPEARIVEAYVLRGSVRGGCRHVGGWRASGSPQL